MNKEKVLVTGGAGFVGSTLVRLLLDKGYQVCVLDSLMYGGESLLGIWSHPQFTFVPGDVRDSQLVRRNLADIDSVVHLAAIVGDPACSKDNELARSVNLDASICLLEECQSNGVSRFVFASTCSNYGKMADPDEYVDETTELRPVSLYAETKVAVEEAVLDPAMTKDMCATSLRFATVYGVSPRMRFDLTVNEFTMEMMTKEHLVVYGEQFWRPYAHVRDVARAVAKVLELPAEQVGNQVFNVGSTDQNFNKGQLIEMIRKACAPDAFIEKVHKDEDPRDYRVSFSRIKEQLGFETAMSVEDGIEEVARLVNAGVIDDFSSCKYRNVQN